MLDQPICQVLCTLKASNTSSSFWPMLPNGSAHQHFRLDPLELMAFCLFHQDQQQIYIYSGSGTSSTGSRATVAFGSSAIESTFGNKLSVNHGVPSSPATPAYCRNQARWTHYCPQNCQGRKEQQTWCQEGGKGK
jgi:hypothetical protein